jgi:hypothetical protein
MRYMFKKNGEQNMSKTIKEKNKVLYVNIMDNLSAFPNCKLIRDTEKLITELYNNCLEEKENNDVNTNRSS